MQTVISYVCIHQLSWTGYKLNPGILNHSYMVTEMHWYLDANFIS